MRATKRFFILPIASLSIASLLALAACGGEDELANACLEPTGSDYNYVVNSLKLPRSGPEAAQLAFDLDGTLPARNDNSLGENLALMANAAKLNIWTSVDEAINRGDIILLVNVKTEDLASSGCAGVSVYLGENPSIAPCEVPEDVATCGRHLEGTAEFSVAQGTSTDTTINGAIIGSKFQLGSNDAPGNFSIELNLVEGGDPITLDLIGARIELPGLAEDGSQLGVLGGAITQDTVETSVIPAIGELINDMVTTECPDATPPECCPAGSTAAQILANFDKDNDCAVGVDELTSDVFVSSMLQADLDLLDAAGNYNPNSDGANESISLGLGFTVTKASFAQPQ